MSDDFYVRHVVQVNLESFKTKPFGEFENLELQNTCIVCIFQLDSLEFTLKIPLYKLFCDYAYFEYLYIRLLKSDNAFFLYFCLKGITFRRRYYWRKLQFYNWTVTDGGKRSDTTKDPLPLKNLSFSFKFLKNNAFKISNLKIIVTWGAFWRIGDAFYLNRCNRKTERVDNCTGLLIKIRQTHFSSILTTDQKKTCMYIYNELCVIYSYLALRSAVSARVYNIYYTHAPDLSSHALVLATDSYCMHDKNLRHSSDSDA